MPFTWTTVPSGNMVAGEPVTASLVAAMYENGGYATELAWHPYDMATRDDGADGVIYDFAVDGAVATVTSPDFADGYEYQFEFYNINASAVGNFEIQFYLETSAAYSSSRTVNSIGSTDRIFGELEARKPRISRQYFTWYNGSSNPTLQYAEANAIDLSSSQKITRVRFLLSGGGNINSGTITMLKRLAV